MYLYICNTYYVECIYDIYRTYNVCNIYIYIYIYNENTQTVSDSNGN